jgi:hypothetical protein
MKVKMKISGAFRTFDPAQDCAALRSVITTARKQGWNILQTLTPDPPPSSTPSQPDPHLLGSYVSAKFAHNKLKRLVYDERIQGNPSFSNPA